MRRDRYLLQKPYTSSLVCSCPACHHVWKMFLFPPCVYVRWRGRQSGGGRSTIPRVSFDSPAGGDTWRRHTLEKSRAGERAAEKPITASTSHVFWPLTLQGIQGPRTSAIRDDSEGAAGSAQPGLRGLVTIINVMTKKLSAETDDGVAVGLWTAY